MIIIKKILLKICLYFFNFFLNFIYFFIKLFPTKNKITFLSRQANRESLDFKLIMNELNIRDDNIEIISLCKKMQKGIKNSIYYFFYLIKCMYHIATSKVCILDSYSIPISVLKHKKNLTIIQIWHALGAIKKFGYQVLDTKEGSSSVVAKSMKMHKNYNYVISPSLATKDFYSQAFNVEKEKILIMGLPRIDYILNNQSRREDLISNTQLDKNKKTILYMPTFRKKIPAKIDDLIKNVNLEKYNLIIRLHPLDLAQIPDEFAIDARFNTFDLLTISDYIITDYSALSIEAALLDKPVFFYLYDYDNYIYSRGLNIELFSEMKNSTEIDIKNIINKIENNDFNYEELNNFKNKYVENISNNNTKQLVDFILQCWENGNNVKFEETHNRHSKEKSIV